MPPTQIPLTLIVAATAKNGIGKNGGLPWPMLKKEMAYFARVTKRVPTSTSTTTNPPKTESETANEQISLPRNAVIMGRKTWDSIPPKFRPLKDRTNVVISSQGREKLAGVTDDVLVAGDVQSALRELQAAVESGRVPELGRAFVIGGARVYGDAMGLEQARSVLLTRVREDYECDTFFPDLGAEGSGWRREGRGVLEEFVGEGVQEGGLVEGGVGFEFQLWRRG